MKPILRRIGLTMALLVSGCGWFTEPARLPPIPDPQQLTTEEQSAPQPVDEEAVAPDTPELGVPEDETVRPPHTEPGDEPNSVVAALAPGALPNEVAAARLVEAARSDLAAGNSDAALERLEQAISIDATNPYAYYFLARTHLNRRDYGQALGFADRAAALGNRADPDWLARSIALRGEIFERAGRFPEARTAYSEALEIDSTNGAALDGLHRLGR